MDFKQLQETVRERSAAFCSRFGVEKAVMNAPMAQAAGPELAAAVSNAGGLGVLAGDLLSPDELAAAIERVRELTGKPFAVNLRVPVETDEEGLQLQKRAAASLEDLAAGLGLAGGTKSPLPDFEAQFEVLLQKRVPVVSVTFGGLREIYAERLEAAGIPWIGTATTLREAKVLRAADAAAVVVQGVEAAGPRLSFEDTDAAGCVGLMSLIGPAARATGLPVIASGGIATAQQVCAALICGASAVMAGSAFAAVHESALPRAAKDMLSLANESSVRLTRVFDGRLSRVLATGLVDALEEAGAPVAPYPLQFEVTRPIVEAAQNEGRTELFNLPAGQSAAYAQACPAARIVDMLASGFFGEEK